MTRCVVFGATGYLGGRLVPALLAAGYQVRAVARTPGKLAEVPWRDGVEIVEGDVTDPGSVRGAVAGQDIVYYLVHSLNRRDFVDVDRRAAQVPTAGAVRTSRPAGHLYWRTIAPFHGIVFGGMVGNIPGVAERHAGRASGPAVHVMPEGEQ